MRFRRQRWRSCSDRANHPSVGPCRRRDDDHESLPDRANKEEKSQNRFDRV